MCDQLFNKKPLSFGLIQNYLNGKWEMFKNGYKVLKNIQCC